MLRSGAFLEEYPLNTDAAGAAPPDAFGPFRVLHQIGAGTLGPVFRAYDPQEDRLVAVKLFRLDLAPERVHVLVAGLEKLIAADLGHPAIAAPIACGMVELSAYLALDFVAADSLDTVTREFGASPLADAVRVATQLAGALDFAAAVGVLHGSLHPRDVLLASDDARLTGLGIAQAIESVSSPAPVRRPYAAPERVAGQPWDRRADIFSLAVLIAETVTGRRPSSLAALDSLFESVDGDRAALKGVFARAMADAPADRFETALAFADALKQVVDASPIAALVAAADAAAAPAGDEVDVQSADAAATDVADAPVASDATDAVGSLGAAAAPASSASLESPAALATPGTLGTLGTPSRRSRRQPEREPVREFDLPLTPVAPRLPLDEPTVGPAEALLPGDVAPLPLEPEPLERFDADDLTMLSSRVAVPETAAADWDLRETTTDASVHDRTGDGAIGPDVAPAAARNGLKDDLRSDASPLPPAAAAAAARLANPPPSSSPSVWPIPLALMVGLIVGIAVGFFIFGSRPSGGDADATITTTPAATTAAASAPSGSPGSPGSPSAPAAAAPTVPAASTPPPAPPANSPAAAAPAVAPNAAPGVASPATPPTATTASTTPPATAPAAANPPRPSPASAPSAAARGEARRDGRLLVRTSPAGARVQLNGKDVGVTPITLRAVAAGAHTVRVTREGYVAEERRVTVSASQPSQSLTFALARERRTPPASQTLGATRPASAARPANAPGAPPATTAAGYSAGLIVESRPPGAAVFIDGRRVGTTPLTVDPVPTGSHVIRLELDGYRRWSSSVRVAAGERNRVTASLEQ